MMIGRGLAVDLSVTPFKGVLMRFPAILVCFLALPSLFAESPVYRITHKFTLAGEGRWDYVVPDPPRHRLFIGRENRVMVVNERNGKLLGAVLGIDGAHGVALVRHTGHGFATSGNDGSIVMFDLRTLKPLARIPAAEDADAIIYDSVSDRVFSFNGDAHSSTVVDPGAGKLVTNIPLGGKPESGVSAGNGKVYVNITDTNEVAEIDASALQVTRRWSTEPCQHPVAMAIDLKNHRLFSGCRSGAMAVSDYDAGTVVATVPIGEGVDGAAFDPDSGDAFASNGDGTLTVIHQDGPDKYHVVENVKTMRGARTMGLDPTTHQLFLVSARFGPVPPATPENPRRRPPMVPGTFTLMVIERTPDSQ
ncbi:MAG: YncE family protein [Acidobacteriota bacterium]